MSLSGNIRILGYTHYWPSMSNDTYFMGSSYWHHQPTAAIHFQSYYSWWAYNKWGWSLFWCLLLQFMFLLRYMNETSDSLRMHSLSWQLQYYYWLGTLARSCVLVPGMVPGALIVLSFWILWDPKIHINAVFCHGFAIKKFKSCQRTVQFKSEFHYSRWRPNICAFVHLHCDYTHKVATF